MKKIFFIFFLIFLTACFSGGSEGKRLNFTSVATSWTSVTGSSDASSALTTTETIFILDETEEITETTDTAQQAETNPSEQSGPTIIEGSCDSRFKLESASLTDYKISFSDTTPFTYVSLAADKGMVVQNGPQVVKNDNTKIISWIYLVSFTQEDTITVSFLKEKNGGSPGIPVASCKINFSGKSAAENAGREKLPCLDPKTWCLKVTEAGKVIENLLIELPPENDKSWLCIYDQCNGKAGGVNYGGGILVTADNVTIRNVEIIGGVTGIGVKDAANVKILKSSFSNQSGWGIYLNNVKNADISGNSFKNAIRDCNTPDGSYIPDGCEAAAFMGINLQQSTIEENSCSYSGNCYYLNGENELASNDNIFKNNECYGSPHNCFELTFSTGNLLEGNKSGKDFSGRNCKYPFWIGCSSVRFSKSNPNRWSCEIGAQNAYNEAKSCPKGGTVIIEQ